MRPRLQVRLRCPYCRDRLQPPVTRCPACGTRFHAECAAALGTCALLGCAGVLAAGATPRRRSRRRGRRRLAWAGVVLGAVAVAAAGWAPSVVVERKQGLTDRELLERRGRIELEALRESFKKSGLPSTSIGEKELWRKADALRTLARRNSTRNGYRFSLAFHQADRFVIRADPEAPGVTGDRHFAVDQDGRLFESTAGPVPVNAVGSIPPGVHRLRPD